MQDGRGISQVEIEGRASGWLEAQGFILEAGGIKVIKTIKMLIEKGEHLMITFTPKPPDLPVVLAKHCPGVPPRGCMCVN